MMFPRFTNVVPIVIVCALFPGLFVYSYLVALGVTPLIPGWWSGWNAVAMAGLGPLLILHAHRTQQWAIHVPLAILVTVIAFEALYYLHFGEPFQRGLQPFLESGKLVVGLVGLYCVGFFLKPGDTLRKILLASLVLMAILTVFSLDPGTMTFIAIERFEAPAGTAGYQWFALGYAMTAILSMAFVRQAHRQALVVGISLPTLFILSSRSDLYGFVFVTVIWTFILLVRRFPKPILRATSIAVAASLVIAGYGEMLRLFGYEELLRFGRDKGSQQILTELAAGNHIDVQEVQRRLPNISALDAQRLLEDSKLSAVQNVRERQLEVFDLESSRSFAERAEFFERGWLDIQTSPLWGIYAGQLKSGHFGTYVHNAISAWHQFGILVFALYMALLVATPVISGLTVWVGRSNDSLWWAALYVSAFAAILMVATKSVYWPVPALGWGLLASRIANGQLTELDFMRLRVRRFLRLAHRASRF